MPSLELRLPYMVMRIDESGRYNLASAVNHLRLSRRGIYMSRNAGNLVSFDEKRVASKWHGRLTPRRTWHQDGSVAQKNRLGRHGEDGVFEAVFR